MFTRLAAGLILRLLVSWLSRNWLRRAPLLKRGFLVLQELGTVGTVLMVFSQCQSSNLLVEKYRRNRPCGLDSSIKASFEICYH
jgi:hypothetical protein